MGTQPSEQNRSYGQILKSTSLVGGSQVINILLGILRTKVMAVLLGPAGIGLIGLYGAVTGLVSAVTGMGIGSSGVRQIAEAAGTRDELAVARTILTLRRTNLVLGLLGMLVTIALCTPLSQITFGNTEHWEAISVLSVTLFLGAVSGGQVALVQGMRRIGDLAALSVLGAILGTVLSIPMVYFWGGAGVVPYLVTLSAMTTLTSWWYAREIPLAHISLSWKKTWLEARKLLSLGLVFMVSSLMGMGVTYLIRVFVVRQIGMEGVGFYQAATTLSSLYIGFILNAMGMDFYPRLTAVVEDHCACNRMVNEQTEVGLLVAAPGILVTLTLAHLVIELFYSARFFPAYDVLRWQILGICLRVVSWPMGFIILAKGNGKLFFWTELIANALHVALIWVGVSLYNLQGTGMAFFVLYLLHTLLMLVVGHHLTGFRWSRANVRLIIMVGGMVAAAFLLPFVAPSNIAVPLGIALTLASTAYSLRTLVHLVGFEWLVDVGRRLKTRLGL